ncbi:LysR family transcriptional regulator [Actinomadura kijaniata]|uniref:LysR family transcriptional regulator n=1 Tax=Actinomadura kijaniata TaxID=46161 RepID=UPI0008376E53|nr:LysR family transcriptional regulator [Actinomadura kijaniata]
MDLDLGAVRAFVTVADERSFSHAADLLGLSQQAVSKRVARLEADLGATLLFRTRTGAEPTADGSAFLVPARALLGLADQAVELVRSRLRSLRVDVLRTRLASIEMVRGFHEAHPDVGIDVVTSDGLTAAAPALLAGTVDAFLGRATADLDSEIARVPAYVEPLELLVSRRHPFAGRERVPMAELAGTTAWMPGNAHDTEWAEYYRYLNAEFGVGIDTSGPDFGMEYFVERIGGSDDLYSFVGSKILLPWHPDVVHVPIVDPTPAYPWLLMWHRQNRHPALPLLISHIRDGYRPLDPGRQWLPEPDRAAFLP